MKKNAGRAGVSFDHRPGAAGVIGTDELVSRTEHGWVTRVIDNARDRLAVQVIDSQDTDSGIGKPFGITSDNDAAIL